MNGLEFARVVRAGGPWSKLADDCHDRPFGSGDARIGREAGFNDYVAKFEREALVVSLRASLAASVHA